MTRLFRLSVDCAHTHQDGSLVVFAINEFNLLQAECEKHFCIVGKLIRTTLTTHPNNLVEVTGDGPNATLTLPHGLPFELKKYVS